MGRSGTAAEPFPAVLIEPDERARQVLATALVAGGADPKAASDRADAASLVRRHKPDLVVLNIDGDQGVGLAAALRLRAELPHASLVLYVHEPSSGAAKAAVALGCECVLTFDAMLEWLAPATRPLKDLARARSLTVDACRRMPRLPPCFGGRYVRRLEQGQEEFTFAYLVGLMVITDGDAKAASALAGKSYTTLLGMLDKRKIPRRLQGGQVGTRRDAPAGT